MNDKSTITRRGALGTLGATLLPAPFIRTASAQAADVPLGLVLPFTGATGPYGPDMKKAARTRHQDDQ